MSDYTVQNICHVFVVLLCALGVAVPLYHMTVKEDADREAFCLSRKTSPWTLTFNDHRKCQKYWSDLYE